MTDVTDVVAELIEREASTFFGKYRGVVSEVGEADDQGYIRVRVPSIYGEAESPWAAPCVPFAGEQHGLVALPEIGDGVWIEFEAGDISHPVWSGFWWAQGEMPSDSGPQVRALVTPTGLKVLLDDEAGEMRFEHPDGPFIRIGSRGIVIQVGGTSKVELSASGVSINGGAVEVR